MSVGCPSDNFRHLLQFLYPLLSSAMQEKQYSQKTYGQNRESSPDESRTAEKTDDLLLCKRGRLHSIPGGITGRDTVKPVHQSCRRGKMYAVSLMVFKQKILHNILIHRRSSRSQRIGGMGLQHIQYKCRRLIERILRMLSAQFRQPGQNIFRDRV